MPNNITLPVQYIQALDIIYKEENLTSFLDSKPANVQMIGKQMKIKKISTQGPADMARTGDIVTGEVTGAWETVDPDYDRGRTFPIDALDEDEFNGLVQDVLADYEIQHSIPELDAYRFAKYSQKTGIQVVGTPATLADAAALVTAINVGQGALDGKSPANGRILFVESAQYRAVQLLDTTKSRETLASFSKIVTVPADRFYTKVLLLTGGTGQEAGGYARYGSQYSAWAASHAYSLNDMIEAAGKVYKCTTAGTSGATAPTWPASGTVGDGAGALVWTFETVSGRDINFIILHPKCIIQAIKREETKIDPPTARTRNWYAGSWKYGYCDLYENKANMLYLHHKA
jgi:hypothetical protein